MGIGLRRQAHRYFASHACAVNCMALDLFPWLQYKTPCYNSRSTRSTVVIRDNRSAALQALRMTQASRNVCLFLRDHSSQAIGGHLILLLYLPTKYERASCTTGPAYQHIFIKVGQKVVGTNPTTLGYLLGALERKYGLELQQQQEQPARALEDNYIHLLPHAACTTPNACRHRNFTARSVLGQFNLILGAMSGHVEKMKLATGSFEHCLDGLHFQQHT